MKDEEKRFIRETDDGAPEGPLTEEELERVSGGMTVPEILEKISRFFGWLPAEILEKIANAVKTMPRNAAHDYVKNLLRDFPLAQKLADLIPHENTDR